MELLVSVVIPTFNRATLLQETIGSIKNQSYKNWECVVVDDGSTDNTIEILKELQYNDPRIKYFSRPLNKPKGANACRNFGLSKVEGNYLIFFDSDDLMALNCIENRVLAFSKHPHLDMLIFSMGVFDKLSKPKIYPNRKVVNLNLKETIYEFIFSNILPWNVCRPIFKTDFIKNKIEFNENMQNFQDDEFNLRVLSLLSPKYLSIDETDCFYRFDFENVNKYNNNQGFQNIVFSLKEYYATVFKCLDCYFKIENREQLVQKLFSQIKTYVTPKINIQPVCKTISIFKQEIRLSIKEIFILYSILFLNKCFLNIRGYYYFSSKLKNTLFKK